MIRKSISCVAVVLLSLLGATVSTAGEDGAPREGAPPATNLFSESVAVRVVNVEVFATDKKGNPVHGLTLEDFELYEDGHQVEITHFFAATDAIAVPIAERALRPVEPLPLPDAETTGAKADPSKIPSIVAYIDNLNLRKGGRKRVFADLGSFLESSVDHGSSVMIVVHDRGGLRPVLAPTTDKGKIAETLATLSKSAAEGFRLDLDRRAVLQEIRDIFVKYSSIRRGASDPCILAEAELNRAAENYALNAITHNEITADGLRIMVGALAGWPGLKSLIYVSDGLPQFAGTELFSYLADLCPQISSRFMANYSRFDTSRVFGRITQQANANQVTIHALEARGLTTYSIDSVEAEGPFKGRNFTPSPANDQVRVANNQSTLFQLASDTGGRAVLNANDFALDLEKIGTDTRNYYSLGFVARQLGDGRIHQLRVEVRKPKIRLRHRHAYRDKPVEETLVERTLGALIFDFEDNPLGARVEITQEPIEEGKSEVRLSIHIPRDRLALLPAEQHLEGRLRLLLTARDANNKMMPMKQKKVPVIAPTGDSDESVGEAHLEIGIDLLPGSHELVLAIRDEITASTSYLRREVQVEKHRGGPSSKEQELQDDSPNLV